MTRKHDLPVRWDDRLVTWEDWKPSPTGMFICPPPKKSDEKQRCAAAAGTNTEQAWGLVALDPATTRADLDYDAENRRRLGPLSYKRPLIATRRLLVTRCCHECRQDTVVDIDTNEVWDLDDTDYGDEGSVDPDDVQGALF